MTKISGMCKADPTTILDQLMDEYASIVRGCADVIAFFVLAIRDLRNLGAIFILPTYPVN